jgi:hypothetical protein
MSDLLFFTVIAQNQSCWSSYTNKKRKLSQLWPIRFQIGKKNSHSFESIVVVLDASSSQLSWLYRFHIQLVSEFSQGTSFTHVSQRNSSDQYYQSLLLARQSSQKLPLRRKCLLYSTDKVIFSRRFVFSEGSSIPFHRYLSRFVKRSPVQVCYITLPYKGIFLVRKHTISIEIKSFCHHIDGPPFENNLVIQPEDTAKTFRSNLYLSYQSMRPCITHTKITTERRLAAFWI